MTKENNLIKSRQEERKNMERDISFKRSEILSLQAADREIRSAARSMREQIDIARGILDNILQKIKRVSGHNQEETQKMQEYYQHLQKKIEQATEYFTNAREIQMTVQDMEIKRDKLSVDVENLKNVIREWNEAWNTKENSIKARENAVKNAEIGIQYDRDQLERAKFNNDEQTLSLRKREEDVKRREIDVERREKELNT
jgi:chromosome segregation ATPase